MPKICQTKTLMMKGKKQQEIIEDALNEYPCRFCNAKNICTIQCGLYKSMHNFYRKLGKTKTAEAVLKLQTIKELPKALDLIQQYNQY